MYTHTFLQVCSDEETHLRKGKTVMIDTERYESVRHCKWVDQVIESAPWVITQDFLDSHSIDYVAHDAEPYQSAEFGDVYDFVKTQGKFLPTARTEGVSTSDLITRIVCDYDEFLKRNLDRGVSAKELNISFIKEQQIRTRDNIEKVKTTVFDQLELWELQSHHKITDVARLFGFELYVVSPKANLCNSSFLLKNIHYRETSWPKLGLLQLTNNKLIPH